MTDFGVTVLEPTLDFDRLRYWDVVIIGIFATGDVHGDIKLITVAWAEGIQAAIHAFKEITSPYRLNEKRLRDNKITVIGEKITQAARARKR